MDVKMIAKLLLKNSENSINKALLLCLQSVSALSLPELSEVSLLPISFDGNLHTGSDYITDGHILLAVD